MQEAEREVLRLLSAGPARIAAGREGRVLLETAGGRKMTAPASVIAALAKGGKVVRSPRGLCLSQAGAGDPLGARQREVEGLAGGSQREGEAAINLAESPLAALMRRRTKNGALFLDETEFQAGERLRADFTRGQLSPRLGANWVASVSSGRRSGGIADLTDAALAARLRVEKAVAAVGPELSGVLLDVCCFLKGLEQVESERGWPVRSAKIVLKSALGILARHYFPPRTGPREGIVHWGTDDYRPRLNDEAAG